MSKIVASMWDSLDADHKNVSPSINCVVNKTTVLVVTRELNYNVFNKNIKGEMKKKKKKITRQLSRTFVRWDCVSKRNIIAD